MSETAKPERPLVLRILYGVEDGLLVSTLLIMIFLSFGQIVLRNVANTGIVWGDAFLRYLVLWVAMLGAMVATRQDNHISIDVVSYLLKGRPKAIVRIITDAFTAIICGLLTYAAVKFILEEIEYKTVAFAKFPAWILEIILPIGFSVICLRYTIYFIKHIIQAITGVPDQVQAKGDGE